MALLLCQYEPLRDFLPQHWPGVEAVGQVPIDWEKHDIIMVPEWITISGSAYSLHEIWDTYLGRIQDHTKLIVYGSRGRAGSNYLPISSTQQEMENQMKRALPASSDEKNKYPDDIPAPSLLPLVDKFVITHRKNNFFELLDDLQRSIDLVLEQWEEKTPRKEIILGKDLETIQQTLEVLRQLWQRADRGFRWMPDYPSLLALPDLISDLTHHAYSAFEQGHALPDQITACLSGPLRAIRRTYDLEKPNL